MNADALRDRQGRVTDPRDLFGGEGHRRQCARRVTGVDPGLLDMFHDPGEVELLAVEDGIDIDLDRVVKESVDEHRVVGSDLGCPRQIVGEHRLVVDDLHAATAEDVARPHEDGVADVIRDRLRLWKGRRGSVLGSRESSGREDASERASLLGEVDGLRAGAHDRNACVLERLREAERRLAPELDDHADERAGLLLEMDDLQYILEGERLEVEAIGGVVVGRDGLRIAIDHDGLVAGVAQGERGVHARVVELDPLTDSVRA